MSRAFILLLLLSVWLSSEGHAQASAAAGRSCDRCAYPEGWYLETEIGGGYVSDGAVRFGDYTGLDDAGGIVIGAVAADFWGESGVHWRFEGRDLGLDSRSVEIAGGRQGRYDLRLSFDQLPHDRFESAATPFVNPASSSLQLPADWVPGVTTGALSVLDASLRPVQIGTDRETVGLGFSVVPTPRLAFDVDYRHATKDGTGIYGGSFLNTATLLPRPVDYQTQTLDAGMAYRADDWSVRLGYFGSLFHNDASALRWQNPFSPVVPGATEGQAALEPDNSFHQLTMSGQYRPVGHTQLTGSLAVGRMEQDEDLLPFTTNPALLSALPVPSLDAEVATLQAALRIASRPMRKLRLRGAWHYDERDNKTPSLDWAGVTGDALPAPSRRNLPYDYERYTIDLEADYRMPFGIRAYAGWRRGVTERAFTEVNRSEEDELWGRLKFRLGNRADLNLKYVFADRDISAYQPVADTQPPQNLLSRKFYLADREREGWELQLVLRPLDNLDLGLAAEFMDDDYDDSVLGLTGAEYEAVHADASLNLPGDLVLSAHGGYEQTESAQRGSQSFALPDWRASNSDRSVFAGAVMTWPRLLDRFDVRLAYTYADSTGEIRTDTFGLPDAFPDLDTRLHRVEGNIDYLWRDDLTVRVGWVFEDYHVDDWSVDGVAPATLPRVLGLGNRWSGYDVNVVSLSVRYLWSGSN